MADGRKMSVDERPFLAAMLELKQAMHDAKGKLCTTSIDRERGCVTIYPSQYLRELIDDLKRDLDT